MKKVCARCSGLGQLTTVLDNGVIRFRDCPDCKDTAARNIFDDLVGNRHTDRRIADAESEIESARHKCEIARRKYQTAADKADERYYRALVDSYESAILELYDKLNSFRSGR